MRHNSFFIIYLLAIILMSSSNGIAGNSNGYLSVSNKKVKTITDASGINDIQKHDEPVSREEEPIKKSHSMKTEELAHIHHFHKERVKKLKRHHKKFWVLSKILLFLCHAVLLVCAYEHLLHV